MNKREREMDIKRSEYIEKLECKIEKIEEVAKEWRVPSNMNDEMDTNITALCDIILNILNEPTTSSNYSLDEQFDYPLDKLDKLGVK